MKIQTKVMLFMVIAMMTFGFTSAQVKLRHEATTTLYRQSQTATKAERASKNVADFTKMQLSTNFDNKSEMKNRDSWITWSGEPQEAVGAGNNSDFIVAQRFATSDLTDFNGQYLSKMKFVPSAATCTYEIHIMVGGNAANGYHSGTLARCRMLETGELNIGQWNEVDIVPALQIDASQELWIGYRCISQTGNPAGCDLGPRVSGKGNLIYFNNAWAQISELDPNFDINWCIQGFIENSAPNFSYPAPVTNLEITPGSNGALNATLTWTNPSTAADGSSLSAIDSVIIKRNGVYWASVTETAVGENVIWTDDRIYESGYFVYTVIPVNEYGNGLFVKDTAAVGSFCETTVSMGDTWGDGWQGNSIQFKTLTGEVVGNAWLEEGASGTMAVNLPNVQLNCSWTVGAFPDDVSFIITDPNGNEVFNCPPGGAANLGGIFTTYLNACSNNVPKASTNFVAEANNLSVNLSWINPTQTIGEEALTELTNIVIKRNGEIVHVIENPIIGENMSWTDMSILNGGNYEYKITANNQAGCGISAVTNIVLGDVCNIVIHLFDSFGDGWHGTSAINIMKDGSLIATSKLYSGSYAVDTIIVPVGTLDFVWVAGNYDAECAFIICDKNEIQLYASSETPVAGSFFVYDNTCADAVLSTVSGVVTNAVTNEPIANAFLRFTGPLTPTTTTNAAGEYSIEAIVNQDYSVFITAAEFVSQTQTVTIAETLNTLNFALEPHVCQAPAQLQAEVLHPQAVQLTWTNMATITLEAHNVWPDGSGYQILLDPTANAYGTIFQEIGPLTTQGDAPQSVYDAFEYKIPVNADGSTTTNNVVEDGSISIEVPAGTYDFCITNPTANDRIWIASNFCDQGRQNDFVFESGKHYHFLITEHENGDCVLLTVSDASNNRSSRTFNIYRDGVQIAANHEESTYTDEFIFVEGQNYCYTVETVCGSGITSEMSNEDCVIIALFNTFTINAIAGENGTITPSGNVLVEEGDSQNFTIAANAGYQIENVLVDGESVGTVESYIFENVTANHTIAVSFSEKPAIEELDVRFKVYPNPASDKISVEGENIESIAVYNVLGQMIERLKTTSKNVQIINTTNYKNGMYIIRITNTSGDIATKRVVIAH